MNVWSPTDYLWWSGGYFFTCSPSIQEIVDEEGERLDLTVKIIETGGQTLRSQLVRTDLSGCLMSDCNLCESGAGGGSHTRKGCVYSRTCKVCEKEGISAKYFGESGRSGYHRMKETPETSGPTTLRMPSANISSWSIQTEWENPQRSLTRWRGHSGPVWTGKSRKESESHWMSLTNSWTASLSTTSQGWREWSPPGRWQRGREEENRAEPKLLLSRPISHGDPVSDSESWTK